MGGFRVDVSVKLLFMVIAFAVLLLVSSSTSSYSGVSYKVGDDVIEWSSSNRTFHVGETISFEYDHNELYQHVVQVTPTAYQLCDVTSPIAVFATGNDSITFNDTGYYYFIFGTPGTCVQEQMLDIYVQPEDNYEVSVAPTLEPAAVSLSSSSAAVAASSSNPNPAAASSNPNPAAASSNPNPAAASSNPNDSFDFIYLYMLVMVLFFLFLAQSA